ncbi:MAG: BMC domain-containing protein [Synergistaceae bacterium]|jgi:microcompartment protein CcmL/EutN|nr:BMC domain-containing protein [Synergistaceae bacterium]
MSDALYIVEYSRISRGIVVLDRMRKRSGITALYAAPVCIGKYVIAVGGDVGDVREAKTEADGLADGMLSSYFISGAHPDVMGYFTRAPNRVPGSPEAVGIFETRNISSGFVSLDAALKSGSTEILKIWMGHFIGGKFCWILSGEVSEVSSALQAAERTLSGKEIAGSELIPRPDASVTALFKSSSASIMRTGE